MGLFDSLKKKVGDLADGLAKGPPPGPAPAAPARVEAAAPQEDEDDETQAGSERGESEDNQFDLAGFDPDDEDAFFEAVLNMESEGEMGGTDESRAEIMGKYGIRDRMHWQTVKESVYATLARKYGSLEQVSQREMNFRMGQVQRSMQKKVAQAAASGEMAPAFGITLEAWAAFNAAIMQGSSVEDLLKGAGIDRARWDRASAEWNARMARDTTFAITTVYGNAFQDASKGKYGGLAREANAARAENRELKLPPPMSVEQYFEVLYEQAYAAKQGRDPGQALKASGLSIVDWTDLGTFMGYFFVRTAALKHKEYEAAQLRVAAKLEAKYPGAKPDVDIQF